MRTRFLVRPGKPRHGVLRLLDNRLVGFVDGYGSGPCPPTKTRSWGWHSDPGIRTGIALSPIGRGRRVTTARFSPHRGTRTEPARISGLANLISQIAVATPRSFSIASNLALSTLIAGQGHAHSLRAWGCCECVVAGRQLLGWDSGGLGGCIHLIEATQMWDVRGMPGLGQRRFGKEI